MLIWYTESGTSQQAVKYGICICGSGLGMRSVDDLDLVLIQSSCVLSVQMKSDLSSTRHPPSSICLLFMDSLRNRLRVFEGAMGVESSFEIASAKTVLRLSHRPQLSYWYCGTETTTFVFFSRMIPRINRSSVHCGSTVIYRPLEWCSVGRTFEPA